MIGTTAALLTTAAIGAGTQLAGAAIGSRAASNAARTQQDAARQAYQQALQLQSPYLNVGNQALSTLGRLMAPPSGARYAAPPVQMGVPSYLGTPLQYLQPGAGTPRGTTGYVPLSRLG